MSNDTFKGDNPFAGLNRKAFPAAKKAHGQIVRWTGRRDARPDPVPAPAPDEEAALFLDAVSGATPLNGTSPARQAMPEPASGTGDAKTPPPPDAIPRRKTGKTGHRAPSASGPESESVRSTAGDDSSFGALLAASLGDRTAQVQPLPPDRRERVRESLRVQPSEPAPDEDDAFASAMRDVTPLDGRSGRAVQPEVPPSRTVPAADFNPLQDVIDGRVEFSLASTDEYVEGHVIGLDLSIVGRLQAGQLSPEAHLDLHGLNAEQAFQALVGFIRHSYLCGRRVVLVVPGRGRNSPAGIGVLREKVQEWFTQDPFRRVILAFCTARKVDGGPGSLYVLLRKFRKDRGKVIWDRNPMDPDLYL